MTDTAAVTNDTSSTPTPSPVDLTARIVAAFVQHQRIAGDEVPALIVAVHGALAGLAAPAASAGELVPAALERAVTPRRSLADPDRIVSMIDGKSYSSLKRHIGMHGFTPDSYRAQFGLPLSYPMVAPGYSEARRAMAKKIGLGRKPKAAPIDTPPPTTPAKTPTKQRGRPGKPAA